MSIIKNLLTNKINKYHDIKIKKNIWDKSDWKNIAELENDYVGKIGEEFVQSLCEKCKIKSEINGNKTKETGGGKGDGTIKDKTVEIKTARQGSGKSKNFQHELGEKPWASDYLIFVDISPSKFFISILPNFSESHYKSGNKCEPYFPTRSVCWRKKMGCFKLDTSLKINKDQSDKEDSNTIAYDVNLDIEDLKKFIERIII
jgi:hypothetical protein